MLFLAGLAFTGGIGPLLSMNISSIVPAPMMGQKLDGGFQLNASANIVSTIKSPIAVRFMENCIHKATGVKLKRVNTVNENAITLDFNVKLEDQRGDEGYAFFLMSGKRK